MASTPGQTPTPARNESNAGTTTQVLEAMTRNIPKLKEQNYTQWKSAITHSIKATKLWGYVDGSIEEPSEDNPSDWIKYMSEASAVRSAILGSLEPGAQRHIEDALAPREAWLALEKQYTTPGNNDQLITIEKQLVDLRLQEDGDVVEHLVSFCHLRNRLHGTRFALDEQSSIELLYRSLPPTYRQSVLTPERTEMKDFSTLCARLRDPDLTKIPTADAQVADTSPPTDDFTCWGVPEDIKVFGLTGDKNPLLEERAAVTCRDCLLKDHEAGTPECPQYEWRRELWGVDAGRSNPDPDMQPTPTKFHKKLTYELSEPVKVALSFEELKLKESLVKNILRSHLRIPHGIQQCAIIPALNGRNVITQAPSETGRTTAVILSVAQLTDATNDGVQAIILCPNEQKANDIQSMINSLGYKCYTSTSGRTVGDDLAQLAEGHTCPVLVATPERVLQLFHRGILNTPEIKLLVLDDIDTLVDNGFESQISDIYRCFPRPYSIQTLATSCALPVETVRNLEEDLFIHKPLYISVDRHEEVVGHMGMTHAFIVVPNDGNINRKARMLYQLIANRTGRPHVAVLCDTFDEVGNVSSHWYQLDRYFGYYSITAATRPEEHHKIVNSFRSSDDGRPLITTSSVRLKRRLDVWETNYFWIVNHNSPRHAFALLYHILEATNVSPQNYLERIRYLGICSGKNMAITLINDDTEEINVIREIEQHLSIRMVELR